MQTRQHEQTRPPETSYEETPLLGDLIHDDKPAMLERAKDFIKKRFLKVDFRKLDPIEIIAEDRDSIREKRQRLIEAENQLKQVETLAAEKEKASQEMQVLRQQLKRTQAQIDAIQYEQGTNVESEAELCSLKQRKKNLQTAFENASKEVAALEKQAKKTKKEPKQRSTDSEHRHTKKLKEMPWKKG